MGDVRIRNVITDEIGVRRLKKLDSMAEQQVCEFQYENEKPEIVQIEEQRSIDEDDKLVLQFMDSTHNYLSLLHALSSTLRHGWMDLASARHSIGASRINSRLLDLNFHSAPTTLQITNYDGTQPCFMLRKWISSEHESTQLEDENKQPQDSNGMESSETAEATIATLSNDEEVQKERSKSLSVFGILISPKLRDTQLSFERALETLVEIANMKSSLLYSFNQLHLEVEDTKE